MEPTSARKHSPWKPIKPNQQDNTVIKKYSSTVKKNSMLSRIQKRRQIKPMRLIEKAGKNENEKNETKVVNKRKKEKKKNKQINQTRKIRYDTNIKVKFPKVWKVKKGGKRKRTRKRKSKQMSPIGKIILNRIRTPKRKLFSKIYN